MGLLHINNYGGYKIMADKLRGDHLEVSLLDMDDFVKKNNLQP